MVVGLALIAVAATVQVSRDARLAPPTAERLEASCDDGDAEACYNLGLRYGNPEEGEKDLRKARQYVQRGCDLGHQEACDLLEVMVEP